MTKVNRHRTYGTTPELRIIAKSLIAPALEPSLVVNWWTSWCSVWRTRFPQNNLKRDNSGELND